MKERKKRLVLKQVSQHLDLFNQANLQPNPPEGWVKTIRTAMNMTLAQLAKKMKVSIATVKVFEKREKAGTITIRSLREIAKALDMEFVYAIIPKTSTLENYVDKKAEEKAMEIVNRTDISMSLEDQQNSRERLMEAQQEKANELKKEIPKFLWD